MVPDVAPEDGVQPELQLDPPHVRVAPALYLPASQSVQTEAPAAKYLPASHSLHVDAPSMSEKVPTGHAAHLKFAPL